MDTLKRLVTEEEGATMVEYGLMVALIAVVAVAAVATLGEGIRDNFSKIGEKIKVSTGS